jgi:hypothetical protein
METKSPQEVAVLLGVDEVTIRRLRRKAGLPERQRGQGYTLDEIELLRAQQRYKVHTAEPVPVRAEAKTSFDGPPYNAPLASELSARPSEMTTKYDQLLSPSWDSQPEEALPAELSEQLTNIARQNDRIIAQNDRIEQSLRALHAKLEEMTASPAAPTIEGSLRELLPLTRQKQVRGPTPGSGVPSDLPPGSVTFEEFCRLTSVNNGTMKSRINKTDNEKIRLETTARLGADRRNHHFLTPDQQRKALLQWHLYGPDHLEHPLCPESHAPKHTSNS